MHFLGYGKQYSFLTTLSIDECVKRLTNSMGNKSSSNDLVVNTNGDKFKLFRKTDLSTSADNPVFYGKLVNGGEARVEGYFGLSAISIALTIFLYIWIIGLPLFLMNDESIWVKIRVTLIVFSISSLFTVVNLLWGKVKMKPILDFIQHELDATPITS